MEEIWRTMRERLVPEKYVKLVQDMYTGCRTKVRTVAGESSKFNVEVGLHQGSALIGQSIYAKLWLNPPQIATEAFSSDVLPDRGPEQHTKNRGKSRRANIIFFGKIQNGGQKHNFVYYSVILNTKM